MCTLQVKVLGARRGLCGDFGVNLDRVEIVGVPGDVNVVPVVIVQRAVGAPFDQMGAVTQVRNVMQVAATRKKKRQLNRQERVI